MNGKSNFQTDVMSPYKKDGSTSVLLGERFVYVPIPIPDSISFQKSALSTRADLQIFRRDSGLDQNQNSDTGKYHIFGYYYKIVI